jgi:hypothetical protein
MELNRQETDKWNVEIEKIVGIGLNMLQRAELSNYFKSEVKKLTIPVVVGQSKQLKCDNCKCTPTVIHNTPSGRFCEACRPVTL